MVIEATSLPDPPRIVFKRRVVRLGLVFVLMAAAIAADAVARSYRYYSQIIDGRLASGYLTSRPGLYAAPRVLEAGQKLSREKVVIVLRRAGYVEANASDVWSGSFSLVDAVLEIRPARSKQPVRVTFAGDEITEIRGDGALLDSFTLEPEILSTDMTSKAGKREALSFGEIPAALVHAILAIEDRRFFEHSGVDVNGLARALLRNVADEQMAQGGSTITQQLVKNTYLTSEKTVQRKYAEAATLAGMIQSPARYSPVQHPEAARARRDIVLAAMRENGWITEEQKMAA